MALLARVILAAITPMVEEGFQAGFQEKRAEPTNHGSISPCAVSQDLLGSWIEKRAERHDLLARLDREIVDRNASVVIPVVGEGFQAG